ncbi:MAG: hypothetical protein ABIO79_03395 [Ferruginibacter sp.]
MKLNRILIVAVIAFLFISSCKKIEDPTGESVGTLKDSTNGACLPVVVNGIFKVDSILTNDNYVDVQVNVSVGGTFDIKSDTVNGYSFHKSGTLSSGLNTIRLYAGGKPTAAGVNTFNITYGLSSCSFNITVYGTGPGSGTALYTLGGSPGNCSITSLTGNYVVGQAMTPANKVEMAVNVTTIGTYIITGTAINGVSFSASGVFANPGLQNIFLSATGTPVGAGLFNYPVTNTTTNCAFSITYTTTITNATFALSGAPNNCTGAAVMGTYLAGVDLTASNVAVINVNVLSTGNYSISTQTVNGISFSATGTFNITGGPQQVTLIGTGRPTLTGTFSIPVTGTGGGSNCNISVTCVGTPPVANIDYIPETSFSNWSDKLVGGAAGDTTYVQVSPNTKIINTRTYRIFEVKDMGNPVDSFFHRKSGGLYYQLFEGDFGIFDNPFSTDGLILDSSLAVTAPPWTINLGSNTVGGIPVTVKINCQILAKNVSATVAGNPYTKIIKVKYSYIGNAGLGDVVYAEEERWYARGFGLIYDKINDVPITTTTETETTRIQIF